MVYIEPFRLEVHDLFPADEWDRHRLHGRNVVEKHDDSFGEFVRAIGAMPYRFETSHEALVSMIADWNGADGKLSFEGLYRQQRDLFIFYSSAISAVESALYAVFVHAAKRYPAAISWQDQRARRLNTDPGALQRSLEPVLGTAEPFMDVLEAIDQSPRWKAWKDLRNTMVHRSLPSRLFEASVGGPAPAKVMVKYASTWSHGELRASEDDMWDELARLAVYLKDISIGGAAL